jgi:hypothetical protein
LSHRERLRHELRIGKHETLFTDYVFRNYELVNMTDISHDAEHDERDERRAERSEVSASEDVKDGRSDAKLKTQNANGEASRTENGPAIADTPAPNLASPTFSPSTSDRHDSTLNASGSSSIYQRVRFLNPKQRKVLDALLAGDDPLTACQKAGYKSKGALESLKNSIPDIMDRCGLTQEFLIKEKLKPLLEATTVKASVSDGQFIYSEPLAAHDIRIRALDIALNLRGAYPKKDEEASGDITVQIIHVGKEAPTKVIDV